MLKRFFSTILIFSLVLQVLSNSVYALTPYSVNISQVWTNVSGLTNAGNWFLSSTAPGIFRVNFRDITSRNAGVQMAVWDNKDNFPTEFILPQWLSVKINQEDLDTKMIKINRTKQKSSLLSQAGIDVGEVSSKMVVLADRIQLVEKTTLSFTSTSQLNLIKNEIYGEEEFWSKLNLAKITARNAGYDFNNLTAVNNLESNLLKWVDWFQNLDKLPQSINQVNREALLWLQKECKIQKWSKATECSLVNIANTMQSAEKTVELEETLEFSLIPPSTMWGDYDFIKMNPSDVRISRWQILEIFDNYGLLLSQMEDEWEYPSEAQPSNPPRENPLTEEYCDEKNDLVECKRLLGIKNDITQEVYKQDLLNWFTLWEANSYTWKKTVKVGAFGVYKKLASASIKFYYSYGVGIRIPIQWAVLLKDSAIDDFRTSDQDYKVRIWLKTLDADTQYYSDVWLEWNPNINWWNDGQLFEWKEFVLEFGAGIKVDLRVIGWVIDFHEDIGLMTILATYFEDVLVDDLWLDRSEVQEVKDNNKLDKGTHFTPAFAWQNRVELLDVGTTVPIYATAWFQLLAKLTLRAYLWWDIKFNCDSRNTIWWCEWEQRYTSEDPNVVDWSDLPRWQWAAWKLPSDLEDYKWKEFNGTATYTDEWRQSDDLWFYQNYGPVLSDFLYIPKLIVKLFAKGWAKIYIPVLWWETFWTPEIEVFSMEFSSEALALWTHDDTNWTIDATTKNKIYGTDPAITIIEPDIQISRFNENTSEWVSYSELTIRTNESNNTYDMFTILPSNSQVIQKNPYCENAADWRSPNGDKREEETAIRSAPRDDAVQNKQFDIRARWCALNWAMTRVVTKRVNLENKAFDVYLFPGGEVWPNQDIWQYPVHTYDRIYPMTQYSDKWMKIKYTVDGSVPSCSTSWNWDWFEWTKIDLVSIGKERLANEFNFNLNAIACNSQNQTINKVSSRQYTIKNNVFDPHININHSDRNIWISSLYYDYDWYYTYISYSLTREDPTCNSPTNYVDVNGWNGIDYFGIVDRWISIVAGATIKAKTCIKNPQGNLVFGSDIISKTVDWIDQEDYSFLQDQVIVDIDHRELWDMFWWFGWNMGEDFMSQLWNLLWQDITMDGIVWFNTLMAGGWFGSSAFGSMTTFGLRWQQNFMVGMANMVKRWTMSTNSLLKFNTMFNSKKLTAKWVSNLAKLYKDFDIHYIWLDKDNVKEDKEQSDELQNQDEVTFSGTYTKIMPVYDEYISSKLLEINQCHVDLYNSHIQDIDDTVDSFQDTINRTKDENKKLKYTKAIEKMQEIRQAVEQKYKSFFGVE